MFTSKHTKALKQSLKVKAGEGILESSVEKKSLLLLSSTDDLPDFDRGKPYLKILSLFYKKKIAI